MIFLKKWCGVFLLITLASIFEAKSLLENIDPKFSLVAESYNTAKDVFNNGTKSYEQLKNSSLSSIDIFLDIASIVYEQMALELRGAVLKFYNLTYFHDFSNYAISLADLINITDHCLIEPLAKLDHIRSTFRYIINNFKDSRSFDTVNKCAEQLPDEVAAAHCVLHQTVIFNETMQQNLILIVEMKTKQHAKDMNTSLYQVPECLNNFVPQFIERLLIDSFTSQCGYLKIVNASITDLLNYRWKTEKTRFTQKWGPVVKRLKEERIIRRHLLLNELANHDIKSTFV